MRIPAEWSFGATIPVKDLDGTRKFYEEVLGLEPVMDTPGGVTHQSGDSFFTVYPTEFAGTDKHTLGGLWSRISRRPWPTSERRA